MSARTRIRLAAILAVALVAGCGKIGAITQPGSRSGSANFRTYVAMGTSITAGWQSAGLVEHHQRLSYASLFARQVGATAFTIPSVSTPGVPPLLRLFSLSPLIIARQSATPGTWLNLAQPTSYHNMAVPYAIVVDAVDSTNYYVGSNQERIDQFENVVRHRGTILQQVLSLSPTFVSIEYGSNEVLGAAGNGSGTPILGAGTFGFAYRNLLSAFAALSPQTRLALFTVPDVTTIPLFTTFPPVTRNVSTGAFMALVGPSGPLAPADFVLLRAADSLAIGTGIPVGGFNYVNPSAPGNGRPLLDSQVLSALEAASIQAAVAAYNDTIRADAAQFGAALVDLNGLLRRVATTGVRFQGHTYNADFITGGLFSLDGVHPTDLAHGLIANTMIDAVNSTYGASIPHVDLSRSATATSSRLRPSGGPVVPWKLGPGELPPTPRGQPMATRAW